MCGDGGVAHLDALLNGRSLLRHREDSEMRACAAIALGRVGTDKAVAALRKAAVEKDVIVRNAVARALRGDARGVTSASRRMTRRSSTARAVPRPSTSERHVAESARPPSRASVDFQRVRRASRGQTLSARERGGEEGAGRADESQPRDARVARASSRFALSGEFIFINSDPAPARARQLRQLQPSPVGLSRERRRQRHGRGGRDVEAVARLPLAVAVAGVDDPAVRLAQLTAKLADAGVHRVHAGAADGSRRRRIASTRKSARSARTRNRCRRRRS